MPGLLERVQTSAEDFRLAEDNLEQRRRQLRDAILAAHAGGIPIARIAREAGLSREWVSQIIHDDR